MTPFDAAAAFQRLEPFLPAMDEAARAQGEDLALLGAIASRETEVGQAFGYHPRGSPDGTGDWMARVGAWLSRPGVRVVETLPSGWSRPRRRRPDGSMEVIPGPYAIPVDGLGWGRGLWQMDFLGDFAHLYRPAPWPVEMQATAACLMLARSREQLGDFKAHPLYTRACIAGYNAGRARIANLLRAGLDPDQATTPGWRLLGGPGRGDYGADVLDRAEQLRRHAPFTFAAVKEQRYPPGPPPEREDWP